MPTERHPSNLATVAMMIGSSSSEPAGRPNTHSPSMVSVPPMVMHATSPSSST